MSKKPKKTGIEEITDDNIKESYQFNDTKHDFTVDFDESRSYFTAEEFMQKIEGLLEKAFTNDMKLDFGEINDFFEGHELTTEMIEQIYAYLDAKGVEVMENLPEPEEAPSDLSKIDTITDEDGLILDDEMDDFEKDIDEEDIDLSAIEILEGVGTEDPVRMYLKEIGTVSLL